MKFRSALVLLTASLLVNSAIAGDPKAKKPEAEPAAAPAPAAPAPAATAPADMIKYRQREMGAIGRHFGAAGMIIDGKVNRPEDLLGHTAALVELGRDLVSQFPKGTGPADHESTSVLPKVWEDAEGFAKAVAAFETAAGELHKAAEAREMGALKAAHEKLGDTCGACHDTYTKDED